MGQTKLHFVPTPDIKDGTLDSSWFSVKETLRFIIIIITGCFYKGYSMLLSRLTALLLHVILNQWL